MLAARSVDKLEALASELGGDERALAVPTDVTRWEDNEALVAAALARFGRLDVAWANAGFGATRGWLNDTPEHWRAMVLTNVLGAAYTVRAAIPALKESVGHVLLTGSVAGRRAVPGSLYSATKWAVTAMGESIRADLNGTGVRTTLIEPGGVDTPFFDSPAEGRFAARRHRASRDVRRVPAATCRCQLDPRPPHDTGSVTRCDGRHNAM